MCIYDTNMPSSASPQYILLGIKYAFKIHFYWENGNKVFYLVQIFPVADTEGKKICITIYFKNDVRHMVRM